jgi:mannose-6-phosphate isomerase-like protein (cupin superfamily)
MKTNKKSRAPRVRSLRDLPREGVAGGLVLRFLPVPRKPYGVSLLHEVLPPFSATPALYHRATAEFVYVLKGSAKAYLDGSLVHLKSGDMFEIPAGMEHQFMTKNSRAEVLSVFSPPLDPKKPDVHPGRDARTGARFAKDAVKMARS